jgi:hypothetical protein
MIRTLEACPFCGGNNTEDDYSGCIHTSKGLAQSGEVTCLDCGAEGPTITHNEKENNNLGDLSNAVIDAWNNRKKT